MNDSYYLVIDQGGHATRAMVFDGAAEVVCYAEVNIKTQFKNELEVEHEPMDVMNSVYQCIDKIHQSLGEDYKKIGQAGLATQRSSLVCWNKITGEALSPIISWQDRRTTNDLSLYKGKEAYIHEVTGLYLNAHYGATKMRWCLSELPAVSEALENNELAIAPLASFILYHLLDGSPYYIDPANASRTLLMGYKTKSWETSLLNLFSIPEKILPELVLTRWSFGQIKRHSHTIMLEICTGDQSAAIYSEGELSPDTVFVNAGTGAFVLNKVKSIPQLMNQKLLASVVYADDKCISYVVEGTVNGAGRALQWFADQTDIKNYESKLDDWSVLFKNPPLFINAVSGIGSPYWIAEYPSKFIGIGSSEEKFVAVLESIVFLICKNILCLKEISSQISQIRVAGGLSDNRSFCQKIANLLTCNVAIASEREATAKGVFYLLMGADVVKSRQNSGIFHPQNDLMLADRFARWQMAMKGISEDFS